MSRTDETGHFSYSKALKTLSFSALLSLSITLALILAGSFLIASGKIPESAIPPLTYAFTFLGACAGGLRAAKKNGSRALLSGLFTGIFLCLFIMLVSLMFKMGFDAGEGGLGVALSSLAGGTLGGILSANIGGKRR